MTTVVTGFSPAGYALYGRNFLATFDQYWPKEIKLLCFVEQATAVPRGGQRFLQSCEGIEAFLDRHKQNRAAQGLEPNQYWRDKHKRNGYHYAFDAVKFCRQCFIPERAAKELPDGEIMVWLDADVVTFRQIPPAFVEGLIGDADLCYLGREGTYSEIGFWAVRLSPVIRQFLALFADTYRSDRVFKLREWHSAFVFDHCRSQVGGLNVRNLAGARSVQGNKHVWFNTQLGDYTDHLKGDTRKRMGRSPERRAS